MVCVRVCVCPDLRAKVIADFPGNTTFFSFLEVCYISWKICGLGNIPCFPPAMLKARHRNICTQIFKLELGFVLVLFNHFSYIDPYFQMTVAETVGLKHKC